MGVMVPLAGDPDRYDVISEHYFCALGQFGIIVNLER